MQEIEKRNICQKKSFAENLIYIITLMYGCSVVVKTKCEARRIHEQTSRTTHRTYFILPAIFHLKIEWF